MSKKDDYQCIACTAKFTDVLSGITCATSHFLCTDCFLTYFGSISSEPSMYNIPIKCSMPDCKLALNEERVFSLLTEQEKQRYLSLLFTYGKGFLNPNESFYHCIKCSNAFIMNKDADEFHCDNEDCGCKFCLICFKQWNYNQQDQEQEDFVERQFTSGDPQWHFVCQQFRKYISNIKQAYEQGMKNKCPSCGFSGQKDNNCTHMVCGHCTTQWCYICEKPYLQLQDELHGADWQQNKKSCPIYLYDIVDEDELDQIEDIDKLDQKMLMRYHQAKIVHYLKQALKDMPKKVVLLLLERYPDIFNNYNPQQILNTPKDEIFTERFRKIIFK